MNLALLSHNAFTIFLIITVFTSMAEANNRWAGGISDCIQGWEQLLYLILYLYTSAIYSSLMYKLTLNILDVIKSMSLLGRTVYYMALLMNPLFRNTNHE
jgi:hypothetical protein